MARDQPNFGVTFDEEIEANATREDQDFLLSAYGNTDSEGKSIQRHFKLRLCTLTLKIR